MLQAETTKRLRITSGMGADSNMMNHIKPGELIELPLRSAFCFQESNTLAKILFVSTDKSTSPARERMA